MSSKKCISLENFDPDDLVFDYVKEGKMSATGRVLVKHRLACYVRTGRPVLCSWPRTPVIRLVFRRILSTEVIPFLWFLWIKIILQRSKS